MNTKRCRKCGGSPVFRREDQYGAYDVCPYCGKTEEVGPPSDGPHADYRLAGLPLKEATLPGVRARAASIARAARAARAMKKE